MEFIHYSVMKNEALEYLNIKENGIYLDATVGGAGHSKEIAKSLNDGRLICIDRDADAVEYARGKLSEYGEKVIIKRGNFLNSVDVLKDCGFNKIDGALIDLGISSYQIDTAERGFSYMKDAPLDMRMSQDDILTAWDIVNVYDFERLRDIINKYGEEKYSSLIASAIIKARNLKKINTTLQLADIICEATSKVKYTAGHPAKKTFQALRIEVNDELNIIRPAVESIIEMLAPTGRIVVISFHSLEDKIVKNTFAFLEKDCVCPPEFPICVCDKKQDLKILTKKPVLPSEKELNENSRSKSAKLRAAEKL